MINAPFEDVYPSEIARHEDTHCDVSFPDGKLIIIDLNHIYHVQFAPLGILGFCSYLSEPTTHDSRIHHASYLPMKYMIHT